MSEHQQSTVYLVLDRTTVTTARDHIFILLIWDNIHHPSIYSESNGARKPVKKFWSRNGEPEIEPFDLPERFNQDLRFIRLPLASSRQEILSAVENRQRRYQS